MDIKSMNSVVKNDEQDGLFDLFDTFLLYRPDVLYGEYEVKKYEEMRIDIIFQSIYGFEANEVGLYLENIDIILLINDIDNPLNIKEGMIIKYPYNIEDFIKFRYVEDKLSSSRRNVIPKLAVPNLSTKKDKDREKYQKSGYSLPPVVLETPKAPVRVDNGRIKMGGL